MFMMVRIMCTHDQVADTDYLPQGINYSTSTASLIAMDVRKRASMYSGQHGICILTQFAQTDDCGVWVWMCHVNRACPEAKLLVLHASFVTIVTVTLCFVCSVTRREVFRLCPLVITGLAEGYKC